MHILDNIPLQIDINSLLKELRVKEGSEHAEDVKRLAGEVQAIGRPKALYKVAFIDSKGEDCVTVEGVVLRSRVLRVNLEQAHKVFPFVATCGVELEEWANSIDDFLLRYYADTIKEKALRVAIRFLDEHLAERYRPGRTARMNPGSLADWPLKEQRPLFAILGNTKDTIGVQLTDSLLMLPTKSVSGILFPTETSFESCQLCPRENCPGRRSPYDEGLYDRRYGPKTER
jgi:hypothetical protein